MTTPAKRPVRRSKPAVVLTPAAVSEWAIRGLRAEVDDHRVGLALARRGLPRKAIDRTPRQTAAIAKAAEKLAVARKLLDGYLQQIGDGR